MLEREVGTSFSDLWYRVAHTHPRLSVHARIARQRYGPETVYIVEDPASGHYYRLTEPAMFFIGLLSGRRTVDQAWEACCAQLGDGAPTQRECIDLLAKLQLFGLLVGDEPLAPEMIEHRGREARSTRRKQRTGRYLFPHIPLINPERFLVRHERIIGAIFSKPMAVLWLLMVGTALVLVIQHARDLGSELNTLLTPSNIFWMGVLFLAIRAIHEFGHAAACKAMGGRCSEIGLILIAWVLPLPYCDASSAWRFPEISKRVLVSSAGMIVEFFFAAIAAMVWVATLGEEASLAHTLAYNAMVISSVMTFLFNLNPLLRYDGYYILSDLAGAPNLAQRSKELGRYLIERFAFGMRGLDPPAVRDRGELSLLLAYSVLSPPYRLFVGLSILLVVSTKFISLGLILAAVMAVMWFVWPVLKGVGYLASSPKLFGRRARAVGVVMLAVVVVGVLVGAVPVRAGGYATGTLEPMSRSVIRARQDGVIARVLVTPGQRVQAGQPLFELENPLLVRDLKVLRGQLAAARVQRDLAVTRTPAQQRVAQSTVEHLTRRVARAQRHLDELVITAPISGRLIVMQGTGLDVENAIGRYVQRGTLLAAVADTDDLRLRALISDRERAYVFRGSDEQIGLIPAQIRVRGRAGKPIRAVVTSIAPAGSHTLTTASLATGAGGSIVLDPTDQTGGRTLIPYFLVEVRPDPDERVEGLMPGQRARVRFSIGRAPLAVQAWRRARQYVSGKLGL